MQLTLAERLLLRNQLKIMKALKVPDASDEDYDEHIEILEGGYAVFYPDILSGLDEHGTDPEVTAEVIEIFEMFRALDSAKRNGMSVTKGFEGYDGNNDPHCSFARFVLEVQGKFDESAPMRNSHTQSTLPKYRKMVSTWKSLGRGHTLSQSDVDAIQA